MRQTQLVAILNLTPDSFSSDGVGNVSHSDVMNVASRLLDEGADVIDVGAESTRPHATPLSAEEEWQRLALHLPHLIALCHEAGKRVSLDTRHASTAARAVAMGVDWINDVTGLSDPRMIAAVEYSDCKLVVMHALSVPVDPVLYLPEDKNPLPLMQSWAQATLVRLQSLGIASERIILDCGIGFGKTAAQNIALLASVHRWQPEGCPVLIGHSRKSFLSLISNKPAAERDELTLLASAFLMAQGVDYVRVHALAPHRALREKM